MNWAFISNSQHKHDWPSHSDGAKTKTHAQCVLLISSTNGNSIFSWYYRVGVGILPKLLENGI